MFQKKGRSRVTIEFGNRIKFAYQVVEQGDPTILRGEFFRDHGDTLGIKLEVVKPSWEEAIDAIQRCSSIVAANFD
ncbi:MAG: hypothetical protein PHE55_13050 [Methylococcaceae bacterium]|nr:hypothetical protein [Methylococcaceae bacterium]